MSRRLRPRRVPKGQLFPPDEDEKAKPQSLLVARRQALVGPGGDPRLSTYPLGIALARGHITARMHDAGRVYEGLAAKVMWQSQHPKALDPAGRAATTGRAGDPGKHSNRQWSSAGHSKWSEMPWWKEPLSLDSMMGYGKQREEAAQKAATAIGSDDDVATGYEPTIDFRAPTPPPTDGEASQALRARAPYFAARALLRSPVVGPKAYKRLFDQISAWRDPGRTIETDNPSLDALMARFPKSRVRMISSHSLPPGELRGWAVTARQLRREVGSTLGAWRAVEEAIVDQRLPRWLVKELNGQPLEAGELADRRALAAGLSSLASLFEALGFTLGWSDGEKRMNKANPDLRAIDGGRDATAASLERVRRNRERKARNEAVLENFALSESILNGLYARGVIEPWHFPQHPDYDKDGLAENLLAWLEHCDGEMPLPAIVRSRAKELLLGRRV